MMKRIMRQTGWALLAALLLGSGCDREIETREPLVSLPEAPPTPTNLTVRNNDRSVTLSWAVADTAVVARSRIYRADSDEADFFIYDSTAAFSKEITGLPFDHSVRLRVTSVDASGIESRPSVEVRATAGVLAIVIEDDDEYTNGRNVQVQITVPVAAEYVELAEDPTLAGAPLRPYGSSLSFELSAGDGPKTVYARITFGDGLEAGEIVSDDITLDTKAHIDSVFFAPAGQVFSVGDTITFFVAAGGETGGSARVSFSGVSNLILADDGAAGDVAAGDGLYSARYIVPVALTVTDGVVTGKFTDAAGNAATDAQAAQLLDIQTSTPPASVVLAVGLIDATTAHLTWTRSEDDEFASYRIYRSVSPGIVVGNSFLTIAIVTEQNTVSHDDYLSGSGTYYYRLFVFDTQGSSSASNEVVITR